MITLTQTEMTALWRKILHLDVPRSDCSVEREDGIDIDSLIDTRIRQWYAQLLRTALLHCVPIEDFASSVTPTRQGEAVQIVLPERCVRPVEVQLNGWQQSVTTFLTPESPEARMQASALMRGGTERPAAIDFGNRIMLYSLPESITPTITTLRAVATPSDGSYILSEDALNTIEQFGESLL